MRRTRWTVALATLLCLTRGLRAEVQAGAEAYTEAKFAGDCATLLNTLVVGRYKTDGKRGDAWDAAATTALSNFVPRLANSWADALDGVPVKSDEQIAAEVETARQAGCADPVLLYAAAELKANLAERRTLLNRAAETIDDVEYSPLLKMLVYERAAGAEQNSEAAEGLWRLTAQCASRAMLTGVWRGRERSVVARRIEASFAKWPNTQRDEFADRLNPDVLDPWLYQLFLAREQYRVFTMEHPAPALRRNVSPEQVSTAALENAKVAGQAAYALAPELPEASALMVDLFHREDSENAVALRDWFGKMSQAQFDFPMNAPWAGVNFLVGENDDDSAVNDGLLALTADLIKTKRYDTKGPWRMFEVIRRDAAEHGGYQAAIGANQPSVPALCTMFDGYRARTKDAKQAAKYAAMKFLALYCSRRYREAETFATEVGPANLSQDGAGEIGLILSRVLAANTLLNSKLGTDAQLAEQSVQALNFDDAINKYKAIAKKSAAHSAGETIALVRVSELTWLRDTNQGRQVSVQPDDMLRGLYGLEGTWKAGGGELTGTPDGDGNLRILFGTNLGENSQFSATIRFDPAPAKVGRIGLQLGMLETSRVDEFYYDAAEAGFRFKQDGVIRHAAGEVNGGTFKLKFKRLNNVFTVQVNDAPAGDGFQPSRFSLLNGSRIGIVAHDMPAGAKVVVTEMKLGAGHSDVRLFGRPHLQQGGK